MPSPPPTETRTFCDLLDAAATDHPDRAALLSPGLALDWAGLRTAVQHLARTLVGRGARPGQQIGLCVERGPWPLLGSAALLSLGAAYVPLDPAHPAERLDFFLQDAGVELVLADPAGARALAGRGVDVVLLHPDLLHPDPHRTDRDQPPLPPPPGPDDVAYVIYTSGSTGRPKGVPVRHRNVLSMLAGILPRFDFGPDEVWPLLHAHTFDVSVWEMWGAVAIGAQLVTLTEDAVRDPLELAEILISSGVTTLSVVPSIFRHLAETVLDEQLDLHLRRVVFAGEKLDRTAVRHWRQTRSGAGTRWFNVYGVTEAAIYNTFRELTDAELERDEPSTPIGRPLPGSPALVLGPDLRERPSGEPGELVLGGAQVAVGYLNRTDLTVERFCALPNRSGVWYRTGDTVRQDDLGDLHYVGRMDDQVKIQGVRIELGEVEHALHAVSWIRDAVVIAAVTGRGEAQLVAFIVPTDDIHRPASDWRAAVRAALAPVLPESMLPQRVSAVDRIPQNSSGKADRHRLAQSLS